MKGIDNDKANRLWFKGVVNVGDFTDGCRWVFFVNAEGTWVQ